MKKLFIGFAILLLSFVGFADVSNVFGQKIEEVEKNALLYEISGNDLKKPSYIFGTIHIICPQDMIPSEKFDAYINKTERFLMELDMDDQNEMASMVSAATIPDGKNLADYLNKEQYAKVDELVKSILGVPLDRVKGFHPMILSTMLVTSPKAIGCTTPGSYEFIFMQTAAARKKPIEGLESVAMQIKAINSSPLGKQAESLYKMASDPTQAFADFKTLVNVYKQQDAEALLKIIQTQMADEPSFQKTLIDERNKDWIPKIETAIKAKPTFIAVGGGHLGGKEGILKLLKDRGYKLKPIRF